MPNKPTWSEKIPEALEALSAREPNDLIDRKSLEGMLGVRARQAQMVCQQVGAIPCGKGFSVRAEDLRVFLETVGGKELMEAEKKRKATFARTFNRLREERLRNPALYVEAEDKELRAVDRADRSGFAALPEGVEISPGRITFLFASLEELLSQLLKFAMALGWNRKAMEQQERFREFEERTKP